MPTLYSDIRPNRRWWWALFVGVAIVFWMVDVILDATMFGMGSFTERILPADANENYMRGFGALFAGAAAVSIWRWSVAHKADAGRQMESNAALSEIGRIASSSLDLDKMYSRLAEQMQRVIPAKRIGITLVDPQSSQFTVRYAWGRAIVDRQPGTLILLAGSLSGHVTRTGETVLWPSDAATRELMSTLPGMAPVFKSGIRSMIAVPLIAGDDTIGAMMISNTGKPAFTPADRDMAQAIAAQIANAIANAELHGQIDRHAREVTILAKIGRTISSSLHIDSVFETVGAQIRELIPADRVAIIQFDDSDAKVEFRYSAGLPIPGLETGATFPRSEYALPLGHTHDHSLILDEADMRSRAGSDPVAHACVAAGIQSALLTPLCWGDQLVGVLSWTSRQPNAFSADQKTVAERIAAQIAGVVSNARLHAQVNRQAQEEKLLADIGRTISSTLDMNEVYAIVANRVRDMLPFDRMMAGEIDHDPNEFTVVYTSGAEVPEWSAGTTRPLSGSLMGHVYETKRALLVHGEDAEEQAERFPALSYVSQKYSFRCYIFVPVIHDNRVVALLNFYAQDPEAFGERELALAERIGAQISGSLVHAGLYAEISRAWAEANTRTAAMEAAADMIVIANRDGTIEYANEAFVNGSGYSKEEAIGQNPRFLASGKQNPAFYRDLWETILGGRVWQGTLINRRKDGSEYPERMTITPLLDEDGEITRFIAIKRDVTELIEAERERELLRSLDAENRELQRVNEARTEFLSTVSHELKTPLTSIMAFSDMLARNREANFTDRQVKHVDVIRRNGQRLKSLIDDLLDVSRMESGGFALAVAEVNVRTVLEETAESLSPVVDARAQTLSVDSPAGDFTIYGDAARIAQVIGNLVSNASKYSPEGSEITLAIRDLGHELEVTVRDQGIGISEKDLEQLFTPFFRAENKETRSVSGTGLGLVIVKSIVESHGGTVTIESAPGRGTTVSVTFSRQLPPANADDGDGRLARTNNEHVWTGMTQLADDPFQSDAVA